MSIDFSPSRWAAVRETYRRWWGGELDRPVVPVELVGRDPGRPMPKAPLLAQENCHDLAQPADGLIDRMDYELSRRLYLGDAFPMISLDAFGPGLLTAMLGARLDNSSGRVWFFPARDVPIEELHFTVDPENVWLRRIKELCRAGMERWQGQVLIGMPDLGGNLDLLGPFRPGERLLFDLYDHPNEVKRLLWEAHACWHQVFDEINAILMPGGQGYTNWSAMFCEAPWYMLQSDFSFMIGTEMFREFTKPELEATCNRLAYSFYHLDGVRQLPHLDALLEIKSLDGVQWVPGAGQPGCAHWPEVYRKIHAAGKKIQVIDRDFDTLDAVVEQIGAASLIQHFGIYGTMDDDAAFRRRLRRYGIE